MKNVEKKNIPLIVSASIGGCAILGAIIGLCVSLALTPKYRVIYDNTDVSDIVYNGKEAGEQKYKYVSDVSNKAITLNKTYTIFDTKTILNANSNYKDFICKFGLKITVKNTSTENYDNSKFKYKEGNCSLFIGTEELKYTFSSTKTITLSEKSLVNVDSITFKVTSAIQYKTSNAEDSTYQDAYMEINYGQMYLFGLEK